MGESRATCIRQTAYGYVGSRFLQVQLRRGFELRLYPVQREQAGKVRAVVGIIQVATGKRRHVQSSSKPRCAALQEVGHHQQGSPREA